MEKKTEMNTTIENTATEAQRRVAQLEEQCLELQKTISILTFSTVCNALALILLAVSALTR